MKLNRVVNTKRNVIFGISQRLYDIILPFVFRTVLIYTLGIQYLGLNSLFTSIIQVLNLAELGVGSAMVYSMYKPIAEDDEEKIRTLMALYRFYYRLIGLVILVVGVAITPFIPKLINGDVPPEINVYILYFLNLSATVFSYWLFAYRNSIFQAHQRRDVIDKAKLITNTLKYCLQLIALFAFKNYYLYIICVLFAQIVENVIIAIASKIMYPQFSPRGKVSNEERRKINRLVLDVFTSKIGGIIVNSADTIVISAFLGLTALAIYQNYYYIISSIMAFLLIIDQSVVAGFGNSMALKSTEENYKEFRIFTFIEFWLYGFCVCCFSALYQPFMKIWMGDELMLDYKIVMLLCLYFWGYQYVRMMSVYKEAGGMWHEDRFRPLISAIANLVINIILVQFLGLYGVVLSTVISVFGISIPWITSNIFKYVFPNGNKKQFILDILGYIVVTVISALLLNLLFFIFPADGIGWFICKVAISAVFPNLCFVFAYFRHPLFFEAVRYAKRIIRRN